jgi:HlyD family secretion protein
MKHRNVTAVCLLTILLIAAGCGRNADDRTIHASGHVEATEVRLAAKVGGRLLEAPLEEGDTVVSGALVARLETSDAEHRLAQARANV